MTWDPILGSKNLELQDNDQNAAFNRVAGWFHGAEPAAADRTPFMKWVATAEAGTPVYIRSEDNTEWWLWLYLDEGKGIVFCDDDSPAGVISMRAASTGISDYDMILPDGPGGVNQVLSISAVNATTLTLDWLTVAGGVTSLTTLSDVTLSGELTGHVLEKSAGDWVNKAIDHTSLVDGISVRDQGELRLLEDNANGTEYTAWKAAASIASSYALELPNALPPGDRVLQFNASGVGTWASAGGGSVEVKEDDTQVVAAVSTLDFGNGIDVTDQTGGEVLVAVDEAEVDHDGLLNYDANQHFSRVASSSSEEFVFFENTGAGTHGIRADGRYRFTRGARHVTLDAPASLAADRVFTFPDLASAEVTVLGNSTTGTGDIVRATSPTIVTPTIASFTSAQHDHESAAGGGQLDAGSVFSAWGGPGRAWRDGCCDRCGAGSSRRRWDLSARRSGSRGVWDLRPVQRLDRRLQRDPGGRRPDALRVRGGDR